jgi:transposase
MTAQRQAIREQVRMEAATRFATGEDSASVARALRVHVRSVQRWRAAWETGGEAALVSKGPPNRPQLSDEQFAVLEVELERGPAAHGWPDQKWTLGRIKTVIGRRFHKSYTVQGVHYLLRRHGWSYQVPTRRAVERDEAAIAGWIKEGWPRVEAPGRRSVPGSSSKTRPGSR